MNTAIQTIRNQIRVHTRNRAATTVPYPAAVRERAAAVTRERMGAGISANCTARMLGLRPATLYSWLSRKPTKGFRAVRVVQSPGSAVAQDRAKPVLVTPNGFRIEGLDTAGLVALLRGLA